MTVNDCHLNYVPYQPDAPSSMSNLKSGLDLRGRIHSGKSFNGQLNRVHSRMRHDNLNDASGRDGTTRLAVIRRAIIGDH